MQVFLVSGACYRDKLDGHTFHHSAMLVLAPTAAEACFTGEKALRESHPPHEGWMVYDMAACPITRPEVDDLFDEAEEA